MEIKEEKMEIPRSGDVLIRWNKKILVID